MRPPREPAAVGEPPPAPSHNAIGWGVDDLAHFAQCPGSCACSLPPRSCSHAPAVPGLSFLGKRRTARGRGGTPSGCSGYTRARMRARRQIPAHAGLLACRARGYPRRPDLARRDRRAAGPVLDNAPFMAKGRPLVVDGHIDGPPPCREAARVGPVRLPTRCRGRSGSGLATRGEAEERRECAHRIEARLVLVEGTSPLLLVDRPHRRTTP